MKGLESRTYYELLGVTPEATKEEIKYAYREIARVYHPDSHYFDDIVGTSAPLSDHNNDVFKAITNAYNILTDEAKRAAYDNLLPKGLVDWDADPADLEEVMQRVENPQGPARKAQAFGTFGRVQEAPKSTFEEPEEVYNPRPMSEVLRVRRSLLARLLGVFGL